MKMNSDLDTKYSKFNKDSPGVVSDLLLQLEVRFSGLVAPARPWGILCLEHRPTLTVVPINKCGKGEEVGK